MVGRVIVASCIAVLAYWRGDQLSELLEKRRPSDEKAGAAASAADDEPEVTPEPVSCPSCEPCLEVSKIEVLYTAAAVEAGVGIAAALAWRLCRGCRRDTAELGQLGQVRGIRWTRRHDGWDRA